jgi:FixJ family two-component response regulator
MLYGEQAQAFVEHESSIGAPELSSVFVVSGDDYVRQCVWRALSVQGLSPIMLDSAAAYLACDKTDAPACIILDVVLPDMSGLELQKRLAGTCAPIIFVTRRAEITCSVLAMKAGAFDFLTVPFASQALLFCVHAALELDRISRPQREEFIGMGERFARLTPREREVMRLIVDGMQNKQVARELGISEVTAQIHRGRIKQKMEVASVAELVRIAIRLGIGPADSSRPIAQNARRTPTLKYGPTLSYGTPLKKLDSMLL